MLPLSVCDAQDLDVSKNQLEVCFYTKSDACYTIIHVFLLTK